MRIIFRADASLQMGIGHVMRCLTLADALTAQGAQCQFMCREHPGNLIKQIKEKGYKVHALACAPSAGADLFANQDGLNTAQPAHAAWLGATQHQDAAECAPILNTLQPDWLIVDHYALDARWEKSLQPYFRKLMVIDDLADRAHVCDLLLDQNLGRELSAYKKWVPASCTVLVGPRYALLRPDFAALREYSLKRREQLHLRNLLITMGGIDQPNATGQVLEALKKCTLPDDCRIDVVMGSKAPGLESVKATATTMPWPTNVSVNISDMALRMADADLCIGAAGSTSWERCTLGLPCILICLADNQKMVIKSLTNSGVAIALDAHMLKSHGPAVLTEALKKVGSNLQGMITDSANIADGLGCSQLLRYLLEEE